jgi:hypothetical protein
MRNLVIFISIVIFISVLALAIYLAIDAISHLENAMKIQKQYNNTQIIDYTFNSTAKFIQSIVDSTQHLLVFIVEFLIAFVLLSLAIYCLNALTKI